MKCRVCKGKAAIKIRRHNAAFCPEHFTEHAIRQVEKAIKDFDMIKPGDRLLLGVSGGKDSLALWDILTKLGYGVDGVYLELGIGGVDDHAYSDVSRRYCETFASNRGLKLEIVDLSTRYGFTIPEAATQTKRVPCSVCGLSKRYILNQAALDGNYDALVMGHNLDDEAATLMGNVLQWNTEYIGRQHPVLSASKDGLIRKVKPLIRLAERETAAYCVLNGIDYEVEECPMVEGNTGIKMKEWLNELEDRAPGAKHRFLFGYLERVSDRFATEQPELTICQSCGQPTTGATCAFCRLEIRMKS
ncbi:MAG: TIGR00269 family protein [Acidimicrobiia bacterium]|nr:TIGR00269 family protein [Acidimicrobiia bacterium]